MMETTTVQSASSSSSASADNSNACYSGPFSASRSSKSYSDEEDVPYSHAAAASAAYEYDRENFRRLSSSENGPSDEMFLRDVPMEGQRILPYGEHIIEFDNNDDGSHFTGLKSNQEYYDVLEQAKSRLSRNDRSRDKKKKKKKKKSSKKKKQLAEAMEKFKQALKRSENDWEYSTNNKVGAPQISKGMSSNELKEFSIDDENDVEDNNEEVPRSAIWRPATLVNVARSKNDGVKTDRDGYYKPINVDKVGSMPKTATARSTAFSHLYQGASMFYEQIQNLFQQDEKEEEVDRDFNLQSLTRRRETELVGNSLRSSEGARSESEGSIEGLQFSKRKSNFQHCDSIVWGDESVVGSAIGAASNKQEDSDDEEDDEGSEEDMEEPKNTIEMHDYSYSDINTASQTYRYANEKVIERMMWKKERRVLLWCTAFLGLFFLICLILYLVGNSEDSGSGNHSYSMPPPTLIPNNETIARKDPPPRPDAIAPRPQENYNGEFSHPITADDLEFVVNKITDDPNLLSDSNTPQGKAYEWCKNDLISYKVNNAARLAQRYCLAVFYYATNLDGVSWKNETGWLSGHECDWFGIKCEIGEGNVMSVTYIDLNSNSLDGPIPPELGFIKSITQLQLWGNNLKGTIPQSFFQLNEMQTLYLDKNQLTGEIYNMFESMRSLKHLDLSFNKLKGKIPHGLGSITSLIDLRLSSNHFSGGFPVSLETLPNLQTLLLDNNAIGGTLPTSIAQMASLVTLRIHGNDFMGNLPDFSSAIYLEEAHLDENYFSGPLPEFGSKRLRSLFLGRNAFTGTIPESIGELSKVEELNIHANHLIGSIPTSISKLTALQHLDLSFNRLTGHIPDSLSGLMQLREIILNDNRLTGSLPDIGSMKRVEIARLNNNLLNGDLKFSLNVGDLNYLKELALQNNELRGVIPEFICDLLLDTLTADCWGPSSPVDCPCCSACF